MKEVFIVKRRKKYKAGDIVMDTIIVLILLFVLVTTFYPMWYVFVASLSNGTEIAKHPGIMLWPKQIGTQAYQMVAAHPLILNSSKNTLTILAMALPINMVMTILCGYFMSCTNMFWKKLIVALIMFTMFFNGGLIPGFLNVKSLGLYNTFWAVVLPGALSVYNAIICKTAMEAIPDSLKESAYIDGANDFKMLFKIIIPLMKPTLAVLALYYGVGTWNDWFNASIYLKDNSMLPIQNILRAVLLENSAALNSNAAGDNYSQYAESIKYAAIIVSTVPILCVYPFLQKYFTKGVMIGAVKG